jgi:hypothetical protein
MSQATAPVRHADRFFIGGQWVAPSSDATIKVIDSDTEQLYFTVPEAQAADIDRAVSAAREAFDDPRWTRSPSPVHRRGTEDPLDLRQADRPLHPGGRRQVR